jgi:hypothetical protein
VSIAGFVIRGSKPKRVIIRAGGPSLQLLNVAGVLSDPVLEVFSGQTRVAVNDNWMPSLKPTFKVLGIDYWPDGSLDAALELVLDPGAYTAIASGKNLATGVTLLEIFEADGI